MYVEAGLGQSNPIILTTITSGPKFPRSWRIRVSQIHCGSIFKADQGCLQYFTGVSGRVRSFNFDPASGRQLSNQDYSICVRMERNFCSIQYNACPDPSGSTNRSRSFTLSGNSNVQVTSMIGGGVTSQVNACPSDWLMVPCAKVAGHNYFNLFLLPNQAGVYTVYVTTFFAPLSSKVFPSSVYHRLLKCRNLYIFIKYNN